VVDADFFSCFFIFPCCHSGNVCVRGRLRSGGVFGAAVSASCWGRGWDSSLFRVGGVVLGSWVGALLAAFATSAATFTSLTAAAAAAAAAATVTATATCFTVAEFTVTGFTVTGFAVAGFAGTDYWRESYRGRQRRSHPT